MTSFKTFALAALLAIFASSESQADTVGCALSYKSHDTYQAEHWEKVVKDLQMWKTKHSKHHPYYPTMQRKLVNAERYWKASKEAGNHWKKKEYHRDCKDDVSDS